MYTQLAKCWAEFAKRRPSPKAAILSNLTSFYETTQRKQPHRDYQADTPGASLALCVSLSSLQGEQEDKVLYSDSDVQNVRNV